MTRILALCSPGEVRVAVVTEGALQDFAIWRPGRPDGVGDVYRGRVSAHLPSLAGAFVALPDAEGFLPDSEGGAGAVEGALLTVRITRAAQGGKGPRLTARLAPEPGAPGLLARGPGPLLELAACFPEASVHADDPALVATLRPHLGDRIGFTAPLLDEDLGEQIDQLARPQLGLPGGMRATIHPTPALVAIDVDTGSASAGRLPKSTAQFAANQAALPELARQIRLRNLSGAILIDLAGLSVKRRAALGPALAAALAPDPLHPRLLGFTGLGLAEILRPRVHPPLHETLQGAHAAGLAALRQVVRESVATPHQPLALRAAPEILAALAADTVASADLARRTFHPLMSVPDPAMPRGSWRIERRDCA